MVRFRHPGPWASASLLEPGDAARATLLAALLGTARAVRRRFPSPVHRFQPNLEAGTLELRIVAGGPVDAELHELQRQRKRLEAALGVPVAVTLD